MKTYDITQTTPETPETPENATVTEPIEGSTSGMKEQTTTVPESGMPGSTSIESSQPVRHLEAPAVTDATDPAQYAAALHALYSVAPGEGEEGLVREKKEKIEELIATAAENGLLYNTAGTAIAAFLAMGYDDETLFFLNGGGKTYLVNKSGDGAICNRPLKRQEIIDNEASVGDLEAPEKPSLGTRFLSGFLRVITFGIFGGFESVKKYDRYLKGKEIVASQTLQKLGLPAPKLSAKLQEMSDDTATVQDYIDGVRPQPEDEELENEEPNIRFLGNGGRTFSRRDTYVPQNPTDTHTNNELNNNGNELNNNGNELNNNNEPNNNNNELNNNNEPQQEEPNYLEGEDPVEVYPPEKPDEEVAARREKMLTDAMEHYVNDPLVSEDRRNTCKKLCEAYAQVHNACIDIDKPMDINIARNWLAQRFLVKGNSPDILLDKIKDWSKEEVATLLAKKMRGDVINMETPGYENEKKPEALNWSEVLKNSLQNGF